jgi:signal transduction histidine kinase
LGDCHAIIKADPARLEQVLWNLLMNAIKFSPQGGKVEIQLEKSNYLDQEYLLIKQDFPT